MKSIFQAFLVLVTLSVLTGVVYPAIITAIAVVAFPAQSHGSLTYSNKQLVGSKLIGQNFSDPKYFWPRPSATGYSTMPSGGSNLIPISDTLRTQVDARRNAFRLANGLTEHDTIPNDMLFTSGSGVDPDISPDAARFQIGRIANTRHLTIAQKEELSRIIERSVVRPQLGFLGSARVNVLELNLAIDKEYP